MWRRARYVMHSVGERANAVDHLLRAPMRAASSGAYRGYLADLYGFVATTERSATAYAGLGRRREHAIWLAGELHALGATVDSLAEVCTMAARSIARKPQTRLDTLGWLFVVERMALPVPAVRRRVERAGHVGFASHVPSEQELRFGISDVAHQLDLIVGSDRDMASLRAAVVTALDAVEEWALASSAASAKVDPVRVRFA